MVAGGDHSLRPHPLQARALARLGEELAGGGRGVVVMPCGAGKTLLGRWFAEQVAARLVVVCVPTLALVGQTLLAYRCQPSWRHAAMVACSDPTSGRAVAPADLDLPEGARDAVVASTSTRRIREFLTGPAPGARLIVSTYHSAPRVAAALRAAGRAADVLVCDEAHRLTGRPRDEFRAVLDDGALPAHRRVFLTATAVEAAAWQADAGDEGEEATAPLSLDDEDTFGPPVYRAGFADAVAAGLLVDYDVEVLATRQGEGGGRQDAGGVEAVLAAAADGSARILTFHSRVGHAAGLARALDGTVLGDGRVVRGEHVESGHRAQR
ncbi:MAG: DEAD/DEAH box helicase family protein, partial [Pseudonocardiaceae bacterium]